MIRTAFFARKRFGAIVGNRKGELYAYADGEGVYRSVNRGASWAPVNDGLGNLRVTSIAIDSAGFLYAGTAGSGVFRSIRSTSAGVELEQASTALRLDEPSPNPATAGATVRFALARGGHATLDLVDRLGRRVASLIDGALPPGEHARPVDLAGLPDGLYFVRLRVGEAVATQRLVIVR